MSPPFSSGTVPAGSSPRSTAPRSTAPLPAGRRPARAPERRVRRGRAILLRPPSRRAAAPPEVGASRPRDGTALRSSLARTAGALLLAGLAGAAPLAAAPSASPLSESQPGRVVLLGFAGADHEAVRGWIEAGELPHLARLAERGSLLPLEPPPPSDPVASWAALVTGRNAARNGVFGSMRREVLRGRSVPRAGDIVREWHPTEDYRANPYPLWSRVSVALGSAALALLFFLFVLRFLLKLRPPAVVLLSGALAVVGGVAGWRARGYLPDEIPRVAGPLLAPPFWRAVGEAGHSGVVLGAPFANDVRDTGGVRVLSGLGFPDARGERGSWFLYTSDPEEAAPPGGRALGASGIVYRVRESGGRSTARVHGPADFAGDGGRASVPLTVERRSEEEVEVTLGNTSQVLREGQWSDLYPLTFQLNPLLRVNALARARLQELGRHFELLVEPLHIDPLSPPFWQPPSWPLDLSRELVRGLGTRFETCGFAPLDRDLWGRRALVERALLGWDRRREQLLWTLEHREGRFLAAFFEDPGTSIALATSRAEELAAYRRLDGLVGEIAGALGEEDVLLVCSDRGSRRAERVWNLNNWLREAGWLRVRPGAGRGEARVLRFVDWTRSRAFALGSGQLYLHAHGETLSEAARDEWLARLERDLRGAVDPATGVAPVLSVERREALYGGPYLDLGPDLVVGLRAPYAFSSETWAGGLALAAPPDTGLSPSFEDARAGAPGIGIDPSLVRGILLSSEPLAAVDGDVAAAYDVAATVLDAVGLGPGSTAGTDGRSRWVPAAGR